MESNANGLETSQEGLVSGWLLAGTGLADRSIEQGFGLARDIHGEVKRAVGATIDWAEATQHALFSTVRHVHTRSSAVVDAIFDALERSSAATVATVKTTTVGATKLVSRTAVALSAAPDTN